MAMHYLDANETFVVWRLNLQTVMVTVCIAWSDVTLCCVLNVGLGLIMGKRNVHQQH